LRSQFRSAGLSWGALGTDNPCRLLVASHARHGDNDRRPRLVGMLSAAGFRHRKFCSRQPSARRLRTPVASGCAMSGADLTAILPFIALGGTVTIVMLGIAFFRNHRLTALLSVLGLILCLIAIWPASNAAPRQVTPLFAIDRYA